MPLLSWYRARVEKAGAADALMALDEPDESMVSAEIAERRRSRERPARWRLLESCANPTCASGWLHLWRSRSTPVFEGGWNCSAECTRARLEMAIRRERSGRSGQATVRPHRIPLGLAMLEQGWITQAQLRQALEAQKAARRGRIGEWLMRRCGVSEERVTRALGLQWSCPVLALDSRAADGLTAVLPRLFVDAFGALPLRVAAGRILYLGFEERPDAALAFALGKMTGLRVEAGLVPGSTFRPAHQRMLKAEFPAVEMVEAVSEAALAQAFARAVEQAQPAESRLVRVHDCIWLRMWLRRETGAAPQISEVRDLIGMLGLEGGRRRCESAARESGLQK